MKQLSLLLFTATLGISLLLAPNSTIAETNNQLGETDNDIQKFEDIYRHNISIYTTEFKVNEIIKKCDEGFDISTTASMAESTFRESDCLEELVVKLMSTFTTQEEQTTLLQLASIRQGYAGAMSSLFNNYVECSPGCGSMWSGMGTSYYNTLLREMALEIIQHHESY